VRRACTAGSEDAAATTVPAPSVNPSSAPSSTMAGAGTSAGSVGRGEGRDEGEAVALRGAAGFGGCAQPDAAIAAASTAPAGQRI